MRAVERSRRSCNAFLKSAIALAVSPSRNFACLRLFQEHTSAGSYYTAEAALVVALVEPDHAAIAIIEMAAIALGDSQRGIVFDAGVEIAQGALQVAPAGPCAAAIVVGQREDGSESVMAAPNSAAVRPAEIRIFAIPPCATSLGRMFASAGSHP